MGCNQSSSIDHKKPRALSSTPMSKQEIGKRIDAIDQTCTATFGGVTVRYAYLSQRGYYPDGKSGGTYIFWRAYYVLVLISCPYLVYCKMSHDFILHFIPK